MKPTDTRRVFIMRPSRRVMDSRWQYAEMRAGRVRQGWGRRGLALLRNGEPASRDKWAQTVHDWLGKTTHGAGLRFDRFLAMLEMRPGDIVLVPHVPVRGRCYMGVVSGRYRFELPVERPGGLNKNDFGHIIPVDPKSVREVSFAESGPVWRLHNVEPFKGRYQHAVIEVEDEQLRGRLLTLSGKKRASKAVLTRVDPPVPTERKSRDVGRNGAQGSAYAGREAVEIGLKGEKKVVEHERIVLKEAGRPTLAARVRHISTELRGGGKGYDVLSFDPLTGEKRHIEVKTTKDGQRKDFFITANELRFARKNPKTWRLYRVFDVDGDPRFHVLTELDEDRLEPTEYRYRG